MNNMEEENEVEKVNQQVFQQLRIANLKNKQNQSRAPLLSNGPSDEKVAADVMQGYVSHEYEMKKWEERQKEERLKKTNCQRMEAE